MAELNLIRDTRDELPAPFAVDRRKALDDLRREHGFIAEDKKAKLSTWSDAKLGTMTIPGIDTGEVIEAKERIETIKRNLRAQCHDLFGTQNINIEGEGLTAADMLLTDPTMWDQHLERRLKAGAAEANSDAMHGKMLIDGIGYGGMPGINFRVGVDRLMLPESVQTQMRALRDATFAFYDVVAELYGTDEDLTKLLDYKRPERIPGIMKGRVDVVRPDIVMVREQDGTLGLRITEFESAPGGHGILASIEAGHDNDDVLAMHAEYLKGRPYRVCLTADWSDYLFEQAAFCKQLRDRYGIDAKVIMDKPLDVVAERARTGWKRQSDGLPWNNDLMDRLRTGNIADVVEGSHDFQDAKLDDSVAFRMAYLSNLAPQAITALDRAGSTMNAQRFDLESKGLMAALHLPSVRRALAERDPAHLVALDRGVAHTQILTPETQAGVLAGRKDLIMKYAAWSFDNKDWGSRSVVMGAETGEKKWKEAVDAYLAMQHPVVVQKFAASAKVPAVYRDIDGTHGHIMRGGNRLTPFFVRGAALMPTMVTLREGSSKIHGATDAVVQKVSFDAPAV